MKKYRFPLNTVLRVRRIEEDREKALLLAANRAVTVAEQSVTTRREHLATLPPAQAGTAHDFMRGQVRLMTAAASVGHASGILVERHDAAAAQRGAWGETRKRVASLERLDDRMREEHALEADRDAQRLVDDLVSARFARKAQA